jgi:hypothetical protein
MTHSFGDTSVLSDKEFSYKVWTLIIVIENGAKSSVT